MQRINEDAVVTITSSHGANVDGFSEGDPSIPRQGTQVSADFMNSVQEELATPLDEAGIALDPASNNQLLAALRALLLDVVGGVGQTIAKLKAFLDGITVARSTANTTAVTATGNGTGAGLQGFGGSGATTAGPGLLLNGGAPTGGSGNAKAGGTIFGGSFNAGATGNTTGAAGEGFNLAGGNIIGDANGRTGGTGLIVSGGIGQAGRGKAIDAQNGDVNVGNGNLNVSGTAAVGGAATVGGTLGVTGILTAGANAWIAVTGGVGYAVGDGAADAATGLGLRYRLNPFGEVQLCGGFQAGTTGGPFNITNALPAQYRPAHTTRLFVGTDGAGGSCIVEITTGGVIRILLGYAGSGDIYMNGKSYPLI